MNQLVQLTKEMNAPETVAKSLVSRLNNFFTEAEKQKDAIDSIVVDRPDQIEEMKQAREIRLSIKNKRIEARDIVKAEREKLKAAMADFTLQDKLWLKSFQMLEAVCNNLETKAEEKEKFAERYEAEQKKLRYEERVNKLQKFNTDLSIYNLYEMENDSFEKLLANEKKLYEDRLKAEEESIKRLKAEREAEKKHQEEIKKENKRLKKEAEEREQKLAQERAEQEKKLEAERKAREAAEAKIKAEKEAQAKKEAEEKARLETIKKKEEEEKRAKMLAPDKEKLIELAQQIDLLELPAVNSKEANSVIRATEEMLGKVSNYIRGKAKTL